MKIAGLILAHHKPELLDDLISTIRSYGWGVYLHVDRKSDISLFSSAIKNSVVLQDRLPVHWGSWTIILATLSLLRRGVQDEENTHFYLLSGQCYPIKSSAGIQARIEGAEHGGNFITVRKMPAPGKPLTRLSRWSINAGNFPVAPHPLVNKAIRSLAPRRNVESLLRGIPPYGGSQWWILSRYSAVSLLNFVDKNSWFLQAFKYSHCGDEVFFQTAFSHLGLQADGDCPTASKWRLGSPSPEVIGEALYEELAAGWHFMARKFDGYRPDGRQVGLAP